MGEQANNGGDANGGTDGTQDQQDQNRNGGDGNGAGTGNKRNKLFADLPDDHPLVTAYTRIKDENATLKPKAKLVDDAEEAKKTDAQKIADLTKTVEGVPAAVAAGLREHLVALHGIDNDDAELFLTGDTPELLLKQVTRLLDQSGGGKRKDHNRREGEKLSRPKPNTMTEFLQAVTGSGGGQ